MVVFPPGETVVELGWLVMTGEPAGATDADQKRREEATVRQ